MGFLNGLLKTLGFESDKKQVTKSKDIKENKTAYSSAGAKYDLENIEPKKEVIIPQNEQEVQAVVDVLKKDESVTVNFINIKDAEYIRALDFLSGATYALDGKIKKVGDKTFFFTIRCN